MKKMLVMAGLVAALAAGVVVPAYAAPADAPPGPGWGGQGAGEGPLHDLMIAAAADLLGLEPADLEARLEAGETMAQIALDLGFALDEFHADWLEARRTVFEQAVEDGLIQPGLRRGINGRGRLGAACSGLGALGQ
jgi:hypothetical protein